VPACLPAWLRAGTPAWLSFTLEDSTAARLRSQQPLAAAVQQCVARHGNLAAVLVNCCAPAAVTAAMPLLKRALPAGDRAVVWHGRLLAVCRRGVVVRCRVLLLVGTHA
jgi:S-methylmethionine-dependent homocysteine/selenocysteine methylase